MYLRIRSALRAYGVPWDAQLLVHPLRKVISASVIYSFLLKQSYKPLSITTIWSKDISGNFTLFSDQIWETITSSSKNPNHQMIHWKLLHRLYLSPLKCFYMHVSPSPNCNLCPQGALGTYLIFFWECSALSLFLDSACSCHIIPIRKGCGFDSRSFLLKLFSELAVSATEKLTFSLLLTYMFIAFVKLHFFILKIYLN